MTQIPSLKTRMLQVCGMDCGSCAKTIEPSLRQLHGVTKVSVSFTTGKASVSYDQELVKEFNIVSQISALGCLVNVVAGRSARALLLQIGGMDCAKTIEARLQKLSNIESALFSFATGRLNISYNFDQVSEAAINERIQFLGYTIETSREVQLHQQAQSGLSDCFSDRCCFGERLSQSFVHPNLEDGDANEVAVKTLRVYVVGMDCGICAKTIEQAQESRAPSQQWVDRFANVYTPIVIITAIAIALIPPLAFAQPFDVWLYRALVMLVIACSCALVISTPVSIVSAIGAATRQGVLFKGGNALETAGHLTTLAFDKTGTITQGMPIMQKVYTLAQTSSDMVLSIAASLEQQSEHPLAKAIVTEAKSHSIELQTPEKFTALPGKGIEAIVDNSLYLVGNRRLFAERGISLSKEAEAILTEIETLGQTPVLVGTAEELLGAIALADGLRLEATEAVRQLKQVGLKRLVMLTGDRSVVAKQIATQVGIKDYRAELLPLDKLQEIQQLRRSGVVGMVGDGINDAPALAAASVSFAVGGIDIALETADVVLVGSDLRKLAYAVNLSRRTVSIIQQNVVFSLVTKGLFLLLGTFGFVGLALAVLADTGTSLLVTANGMRLFKANNTKLQ